MSNEMNKDFGSTQKSKEEYEEEILKLKNCMSNLRIKIQEITERERRAEVQKEAAQASSEAKSQFLAAMSHEIRTPMNAIIGISELLHKEKLSDRQFRYVNDIKNSAEALLEIINEILDFSKLHAGKLNLVPVHYDFNMMIDNVCSVVYTLIKDMDISFRLIMREHGFICLYGDDLRLRQVLLNLLSNAVKFTENGYVQLEISFTDTRLIITVSDTGIGIPAENIPTLFYPFEQVNSEKNKYKSGAGLGLTIVKSIIEMMNGCITVESTPGHGSSFHIEIPKVLGNEALIRNVESKNISIHAPDAKILVVDDNVINLNVIAGLLELSQIKAEKTTSGKQAIEMILRNQYDIVFMDYMMPEMNGAEATRIIRESGIDVPIIATTANAIVGAKEMMLEAGMDDYISKPVAITELKNMLKKWIPADKILHPNSITTAANKTEVEKYIAFWRKIEQIEEISLSTALLRTDGQWDMYKTMLKLMISEIENCNERLNIFLSNNDLKNFRIEIHGMKGSLASIGAMELAAKAFVLETASEKMDSDFCASNMPIFLEELNNLNLCLKDAFSEIVQRGDLGEIPPELPPILCKLLNAFDEVDLVLIDEEIKKLNALRLTRTLEEEIEQIKDSVLMMDYEKATKNIRILLDSKSSGEKR